MCVLPLNQRLFSAAVVLSTAARPYLESIRLVNGLRMCLLFPMPWTSHLVYFVRCLNYVRSMWRVFALFFSFLSGNSFFDRIEIAVFNNFALFSSVDNLNF